MVLQAFAPAKINLGLHVLRKRPDGYHDLETAFLRIPWYDRLTVHPSDRLVLTCSDPALPTDAGNLCMRAALRLAEAAGTTRGAALHLDKRVPYGAGLGGGSSDAATTLRLLDRHWGLAFPEARLHEIAATLGADVPFFLGPPAAYGTGRGDRLQPLYASDGTPYCFPFELVVVVPPVAVSTADAYRSVRPVAENRPDLPSLVASNDLERWRRDLVNDFEPSVLAAYPVISDARARLLAAGAGYAALSGSGSAVVGVFEDAAAAEAAAEEARKAGFFVWERKQNAEPLVKEKSVFC